MKNTIFDLNIFNIRIISYDPKVKLIESRNFINAIYKRAKDMPSFIWKVASIRYISINK